LFSVSTFGDARKARRLAEEFGLGLELSELASADELDRPLYVSELARELRQPPVGRVRSIHGPFMDLVPATIDSAIGACEALGAPKLVLHSGWFPRSYPDELWLENSIAFWRKVLARLGPGGRIHIENVYEEDWRLLAALGPRVGHVHLHNNGGAVDEHRGLDECAPVDGGIDATATLDALAESCPDASWNIETCTGLEGSVDFLMDYYERRGLGRDFA
jgi:sugar phosphate isomerase/epimerase